ncbi:hypothetical protein A4S05_28835 [Nostoc sp. KVJ20]|uniref:OmpA family protein n=1 Tax=Nostoc sp. KVJ20 TaxID=457944 RepID=UPI00083E67DC|nr:OmpA family protein [Nostoc sp. KVJ20]ODH01464.1 hypothetical protein A4S05_28835 [Nostoc sp. KVJ20]
MEDNDEIYVMADANFPPVIPVPPQKKFSSKTLWLLAGLIAISGSVLAYILVDKTSVTEPKSGLKTTATQKIQNFNLPKNSSSFQVVAATQKQELTLKFDLNKTELMPVDISKIKSLWSKVKGGKGTVIITGHTDNLGTEPYNQGLSQKRAKIVAEILQNLGMNKSYQVKVQGFGETKPVTSNSTSVGRAINRHVLISFNVEQ